MHQFSDSPSITKRFARLVAALLEHLLALASLASWEVKQGFKQTLICSFLLFCTLIFSLVGYFLLLAILIIVATSSWHFTLLFTLEVLALGHFLIVALFVLLLYRHRPTSFLKLTRDELLRDIEALTQDS